MYIYSGISRTCSFWIVVFCHFFFQTVASHLVRVVKPNPPGNTAHLPHILQNINNITTFQIFSRTFLIPKILWKYKSYILTSMSRENSYELLV